MIAGKIKIAYAQFSALRYFQPFERRGKKTEIFRNIVRFRNQTSVLRILEGPYGCKYSKNFCVASEGARPVRVATHISRKTGCVSGRTARS